MIPMITVKDKDRDIIKFLNGFNTETLDLNGEVLLPFLKHNNPTIRQLTVKKLGELNNPVYLPTLNSVWSDDDNVMVSLEAVIAIGQIHDESIIPLLVNIVRDEVDPRIVIQAINGLLLFKQDPRVQTVFEDLLSGHPNEMVRQVLRIETSTIPDYEYDPIKYPEYMENMVVHGDAIETLELIPEESVHLTFTSPPAYNTEDYPVYQSYDSYLDFLTTTFQEVYRITKEGRFLIINLSSTIVYGPSPKYPVQKHATPFDLHSRLLQMGWEFIDDIIWVKSDTVNEDQITPFNQYGDPLTYNPDSVNEYLMVYRKGADRLIDWNINNYEESIISESRINNNGVSVEGANIWYIDSVKDLIHSSAFPEELCENIIRYYSFKGDIICDPFAGSGVLGRVSVRLGRSFFMSEVNVTYCDRIMDRMKGLPSFLVREPRFLDYSEFRKLVRRKKRMLSEHS